MPHASPSIASQGAFSATSFAPFAFSPIAYAIQALIEELQAERVNGGGGRRPPRQAQARRSDPLRHELTREEVEAQWELLEARLRAQRDRQAPTAPAAAPTAPAAPAAPAESAPSITFKDGLAAQFAGDGWTEDEVATALAVALMLLD
jgi:hypothetical protein